MEIIKSEITNEIYTLEFDGFKSSSSQKISDNVSVKYPKIRFGDYTLSFRYNPSKTKCVGIKVGCQELSINTVKKAINQLEGKSVEVSGVKNLKTGKFIKADILDETDRYIVTDKTPYSKTEYKVCSEMQTYRILNANYTWSGDSYTYDGNQICLMKHKDRLLDKLKIMVSIYEFINNKLTEIHNVNGKESRIEV